MHWIRALALKSLYSRQAWQMKGGRKANSKQERDLESDAQIEGQIFPQAKYMNTDLLSLNDFPHHVATVTEYVSVSYTAQYEQTCWEQELVLSTQYSQQTHLRGFRGFKVLSSSNHSMIYIKPAPVWSYKLSEQIQFSFISKGVSLCSLRLLSDINWSTLRSFKPQTTQWFYDSMN